MGHYLLDQDYVKRANRFTESEFYPEMEKRGLYIRRTSDGELVTSMGQARNFWAPNQGFSGTFVMEILRKEILSKEIDVMQETMVTSFLTNDGEVVGITALDFAKGEFFTVRAKSVIVATGPSELSGHQIDRHQRAVRKWLRHGLSGRRQNAGSGNAVVARLGHSQPQGVDETSYLSESHAGDLGDRSALQLRRKDVL